MYNMTYNTMEQAAAMRRAQYRAEAEHVRLVRQAQGQQPTLTMRFGAWLVARGERLQRERHEEFVPSTAALRL